jgi:uncharacterized protein (DUF1697 family)
MSERTWIALLRGVNVGGNNVLPMQALRRHLEDQGLAAVRTYIQSGNVVFRATQSDATKLGDHIAGAFGFRPDIVLLSAADLRAAAARSPYSPAQGKHLHLFFCARKPATMDSALLDALKAPTEEYRLVDSVFYLHAPEGIGRSRLAAQLHKALPGVAMTARNFNTVQKLLELAAGAD